MNRMKKVARAAKQSTSSGEVKVSYPRATIEEALRIPQVIKDKNGGNAWSTDQVAGALGLSRKNPKFFYIAAASRDFGFTFGSRDTDKIELAPLGREIVYAPNPGQEQLKKREAFLRIDLFKKVLEYYKGSSLPEMKYLGNTLKAEFKLPNNKHEEFSDLFRENCAYLGIPSGFVSDGSEKPTDQLIQVQATAGPDVIVLADAGKSSAPVAFVIIPFVEREIESHRQGFFHELLANVITPAAREAGFTVKTANRKGSDLIQSTIISDLVSADLVIADLTEHNPNVLFELGIRIAKEKPIALIKSKETGRIFDVDNVIRVFEYSSNLWPSTIEKDLPSLRDHIKAAWDGREKDRSYMKILLSTAST
jgi:hypothetical protein